MSRHDRPGASGLPFALPTHGACAKPQGGMRQIRTQQTNLMEDPIMAKKSITAIVAFVLSLAIAPLASAAALTDHSGTICKALSASDLAVVDYSFSSIRSFKSTGTYVLCPLTRSTTNSLGALVYVDIRHYGTQTTYCSA